MLFGEPLADVQAQAGTGQVPGPRGPEEGSEQQGALVWRHAEPVVPDAKEHLAIDDAQ